MSHKAEDPMADLAQKDFELVLSMGLVVEVEKHLDDRGRVEFRMVVSRPVEFGK